MTTSLYEVRQDSLVPVPTTSFAAEGLLEREDLQRLLRDDIQVLDRDLMVLAEEFGDWQDCRRRVDLLAMDRDARLVVIELKRSEDGGHMELQALRYAAMVSAMTFEQAARVHRRLLVARGDVQATEQTAAQAMVDFLGWDDIDEESFAQDVRILLVSPGFSRELVTAALWLAGRDVDLRCVRIQPFRLDDRILLDVQQIVPLPEAADYQVMLRTKEARERKGADQRVHGDWTGLYYVNVDEGAERSWEDLRRYGFVAAGGGERWIRAIRKLEPGEYFYAYQKSRGYVGFGKVLEPAVPVADFHLRDSGRPIAESPLDQPGLLHDIADLDVCEWLVGVEWIHTVSTEDAIRWKGAFANQSVVCRLRDRQTLDRLAEAFGAPESGPSRVLRVPTTTTS